MLENFLSSILSDFLGDYVEGINKDDVKLSFWDSKLQFKNLV